MSDLLQPLKLSSPLTKEFWELEVLYEDEDLLAINKPAGFLSSPDRYDKERASLMGVVQKDIARGARWVSERRLTYLATVHRLDSETSGVLLLAKSKSALVHMVNQFGAKQSINRYLAVVHGMPEKDEFETSIKLSPHPTRPEIMVTSPKNGKLSVTQFKVLERFSGYTLMACEPLTSQTHQIRVHLRTLGHPVVGDILYGGRTFLLSELKSDYRLKPGREEHPLLGRVALHSTDLEIRQPTSDAVVHIHSQEPKDIRVALKYLRLHASL